VQWYWHLRLANLPEKDAEPPSNAVDSLRLFPIVDPVLSVPVAALLARDRLEEVAAMVSDRSWVASPPLYG
jgi:hypothetical protein